MSDLKSPSRNHIIGTLADILKNTKNYGNKYEIKPWVPLVGGTSLGDLFMGQAPELADDMSYNLSSVIRGGNTATGGLGTYTLDKRSADVALLTSDLLGLSSGATKLSKKSAESLINKALEGGTSLSKRDFIKKVGALSGSAVTLGSGAGLIRQLTKDIEHTIPKTLDNITTQIPKKYKFNSLSEYLDDVKMRADEEAMIEHAELGGQGEIPEYYSDKWTTNLLKNDANNYKSLKSSYGSGGTYDPNVYEIPQAHQHRYKMWEKEQDAFSPKAKQEMREYKQWASEQNADIGRQFEWFNSEILDDYLGNNVPTEILF